MADLHLRRAEDGDAALTTLFDEVGGEAFFRGLVAAFYRGVRTDPVLIPMYPEADLEGAEHRLATFLAQYFGGPTTYSQERGHPRLRMRHAPFHINAEARDRWLTHMEAALDEMAPAPIHRRAMMSYFERAATAMVNTFAPTPPPGERGPKFGAGGHDLGVLE